MDLAERFWEEYRARFGEHEEPVRDLGRNTVRIRLERDGHEEHLTIEGNGYDPAYFNYSPTLARMKVILNDLGKYNIRGKIDRQEY